LPPLPYTERDLQIAKERGEMLVLRPEDMLVGGRMVPLTLIGLRELFRKDPLGKLKAVIYSSSTKTGTDMWYSYQKFATEPIVGGRKQIRLGWYLVKKEVLNGSLYISWNNQQFLLKQYEDGLRAEGAKNVSVMRRTALEAVYDVLLYYVNTGEKLLANVYDWTLTPESNGNLVYVGIFIANGLHISSKPPEYPNPLTGVCPSR
ncbi:MAG: hypothetical protein NC828_06560, partial [Candidatus Omnitrophica bacterium]|nr:hypothetical protein [Candidatus Omnitrophota bacterium]